ncbi:hypothetical protein D8O05_28645, partial [Burkholderia mallei]
MRRTPCQRSARWALFCRARFGFRSFGGFGGREGAAFGVWRLVPRLFRLGLARLTPLSVLCPVASTRLTLAH